jgi:7-keto-8-aminopelargonate synthetase-like enzyme
MPPANAAVALGALRYMRSHPEIVRRLSELSSHMRERLKARGLPIIESTTPIIPLYTYTVENTLLKARSVYDAGVYVNPVLPPATPPDLCLLRTSYMATHTEALLDEAADILARVILEEKN